MTSHSDKTDFFATTRWTMIVKTGSGDNTTAETALKELCQIYWFPLYAYIRGRGHSREDAEDLTQGFFEQLLRNKDFSRLNAKHGRFRAFLLASIKNYMANEYNRKSRVKRGRDHFHFSLNREDKRTVFSIKDESAISPDEIYDREWALTLLQQVLSRLQKEWEEKGKSVFFAAMKDFLTAGQTDSRYADVAAQLGTSEGNLRIMAHRLRQRYRILLKEEISHTLSDSSMVEDELNALMGAFGR